MHAGHRALLEHGDLEVAVSLGPPSLLGEVLEADGGGETGRAGADDETIEFQYVAFAHFCIFLEPYSFLSRST